MPDGATAAEIEIRPYRDDDEVAVMALWHELFPSQAPHNEPRLSISRKTALDDGLFLVASLDEEVVGTVMGGYDGHRGWIYSLGVAPHRRRRGIGTALLSSIEKELTRSGAVKINLQLRGDNADVAAFYQQRGYVVEDRVSMGRRVYSG